MGWMRSVAALALAVAPGAGAVAGEIDFDQGRLEAGPFLREGPEPAAPPRGEVRDWTLMVFINGKNNLEGAALQDVNEMESVGSTDRVSVVVELGRLGRLGGDGGWRGARRYLVRKDSDPGAITSPVLLELEQADMGDWRHLLEFVEWAKGRYPAKRYALIVWNHGSGWRSVRAESVFKGISYDDETRHHVTTQQLASVLERVGGVDLYASDACLMQMASVAYEIKDHAGVIVGSEQTEPADGYDYAAFLRRLSGNPGASAEEAGAAAAETYRDFYARAGLGVTQSVLRARALDGLRERIDAWIDAVLAAGEGPLVLQARERALGFAVGGSKDLGHFVRLVSEGSGSEDVRAAGALVLDYLDRELVALNATSGGEYREARGLAIYLPSGSFDTAYEKLRWAREGKWASFAKWASGLKAGGS